MRSTTILAALLLLSTPALSGGQSAPKTSAAPAAQQAPAALGAPKSKDAKDDTTQPLTVDADKMERFGKASLVIFSGNVVARRDNSVQYADRVEVYMDEKGNRVMRTVSTGAVSRTPHAVLVLDEIEKAHPDIYNILLQVMDHATLTDNNGKKADFRNIILILTTNAGAREMSTKAIGFGDKQAVADGSRAKITIIDW